MDIYLYWGFLALTFCLGGGAFYIWKTLVRNRQSSRLAHFATLSLFILFLSSFVFMSFESYYRWVYDQTDAFGLNRATLRWLRRHYDNNSLGFRDNQNYLLKIPEGKRRITVLGDSFTAGHGIKDPEDRFFNHLRENHPDWQLHLFAKNGMSTLHHLKLMQASIKKKYELDHVLLVYILNDIEDVHPEWQQAVHKIYKDSAEKKPGIYESYFLNMMYFRYKVQKNKDIATFDDFVMNQYSGTFWNVQKMRLADLHDMIKAAGGKLSVVTFPFIHLTDKPYPYLKIHAQLDDFWKQLGVPHLDLYNTFKDYPSKELIVNRYDVHPNEFAHALAAEAIDNFLMRNEF